jgi:hypothetical protein
VFLIMFNTGQALPLPGGRFLCPRIGRGGGAERLRNMDCSWPQTRHSHDHELAQCRTWTRTVRVREQSAATSCLRQQSRSHTVRIHKLATDSIVQDRTTAAVVDYPQPGQRRELSTSANTLRTRIVHELELARNCSRLIRIASMSLPASFPVHIQTIPTYDHV